MKGLFAALFGRSRDGAEQDGMGPDELDGKNLRRDYRQNMDITALLYRYRGQETERPEICQVINVSAGGASFLCKHRMPVGERCKIELLIQDGKSVTLPCQVVRSEARAPGAHVCAVKFDGASERQIDAVSQAVSREQSREQKEKLEDE